MLGPSVSDHDPLAKLSKLVLAFIMIIVFRVACYLKTIALGLAMATLAINSGFADTWGKVVVDHYQCNAGLSDRIVIATARGFTNAQVYSGYSETYEDKLIFGELHSYGFTDFLTEDGDEGGRLYIDDYMVSESTARKWCWK